MEIDITLIHPLIIGIFISGIICIIILVVSNNPIIKMQSAVLEGDLDTVKKCLEKGLDSDIHYGLYNAPICTATSKGYREIVELLIEYGADIDQGLNEEGAFNPLLIAAIEQHSELEKMYLKLGAKIGIHYAAFRGDLEKVKDFIEQNYRLNSKRNSIMAPLHLAAINNHQEVVKLLLDNGANIDFGIEMGNTPLSQAVKNSSQEVAELLIDLGAKTNFTGGKRGTILNFAIYENNLEMVEFLIQKGVDVNSKLAQQTPLHEAAENGCPVIGELLIQNGADIHARSNGLTPLHVAVKSDYVDMARLLLMYGAEVNSLTGFPGCETPLCLARLHNARWSMIRLLERHGGVESRLFPEN